MTDHTPTPLFSPSRHQIAGLRPALIDLPSVAVPALSLIALRDGMVEIGAMLPSPSGGSSWKQKDIADETLPVLMRQFREDPEGTLLILFGWRPPAGFAASARQSTAEARPKPQPKPALALDLTALD